jgi:hypothetical protein
LWWSEWFYSSRVNDTDGTPSIEKKKECFHRRFFSPQPRAGSQVSGEPAD